MVKWWKSKNVNRLYTVIDYVLVGTFVVAFMVVCYSGYRGVRDVLSKKEPQIVISGNTFYGNDPIIKLNAEEKIDMADPVTWAYIAVVGGSLVSGGYPSKEACYGHRDVMREDNKVVGRCVEVQEPSVSVGSMSGTAYYTTIPNMNSIRTCYWNGSNQVCN